MKHIAVELPYTHEVTEALAAIEMEAAAISTAVLRGDDAPTADHEMSWIVDNVPFEDRECERIFTAATCIRTLRPDLSFGVALRIAIIWERG